MDHTTLEQPSDVKAFLAERRAKFLHSLRTRGLDAPDASFLRHAVRELGDSALALDSDADDGEVDESALTITRTITTPGVDRYGDVVLPRGCEKTLANYLANPQVFFGHKSYDLPIAQTTRLDVSDAGIRAVAKFHQETAEARVVWSLCAKGILKSTSIGFLPAKASVIGSNKDEEQLAAERVKSRKEKTDDGEKVITFDPWMALRFLQWDLLEWSVVSVPANPECCDGLTKFLSDGQVDGEAIPLSVRKSLAPFALKARVWAHGFDPSRTKHTGVLMLGGEEVEYKEGVITRLGDVKFGPEEPAPGEPAPGAPADEPTAYETPAKDAPEAPAPEVPAPEAPEVPAEVRSAEAPEPAPEPVARDADEPAPEDESLRCMKALGASMEKHCDLMCRHMEAHDARHKELMGKLDQIHCQMRGVEEPEEEELAAPGPAAPAPEPGLTKAETDQILAAIADLARDSKTLKDKFTSVTGQRL